ncbi:MAG: phage head-tail adapter protein [Acutalibacteraceae bacterium]
MNKEWSEINKKMHSQLNKTSFSKGIDTLLELRETLMREVMSWKNVLKEKDYYAIPFINADGYHSKTIAYSLWHIFRIEDIVVHTLIKNDEQIFFSDSSQQKMNAPIITTGNELKKEQIYEFSKCLNIDALYEYITAVKKSTDIWLKSIDFTELKRKFDDTDKNRIKTLNVISPDEQAIWLVDYWCNKNVKGLIQMPLSRHWIMHIEASIRIKNKLYY